MCWTLSFTHVYAGLCHWCSLLWPLVQAGRKVQIRRKSPGHMHGVCLPQLLKQMLGWRRSHLQFFVLSKLCRTHTFPAFDFCELWRKNFNADLYAEDLAHDAPVDAKTQRTCSMKVQTSWLSILDGMAIRFVPCPWCFVDVQQKFDQNSWCLKYLEIVLAAHSPRTSSCKFDFSTLTGVWHSFHLHFAVPSCFFVRYAIWQAAVASVGTRASREIFPGLHGHVWRGTRQIRAVPLDHQHLGVWGIQKWFKKCSFTVLQQHSSLPLRIFDFHLVVWQFHAKPCEDQSTSRRSARSARNAAVS